MLAPLRFVPASEAMLRPAPGASTQVSAPVPMVVDAVAAYAAAGMVAAAAGVMTGMISSRMVVPREGHGSANG